MLTKFWVCIDLCNAGFWYDGNLVGEKIEIQTNLDLAILYAKYLRRLVKYNSISRQNVRNLSILKNHLPIFFFFFWISAFTMFVAITFPFFGGLLGFFGGLAFAPTTYFVRIFFELYKHPHFLQFLKIQLFLVVLTFWLFDFKSFHALCGLPSVNQRGSACLGALIG